MDRFGSDRPDLRFGLELHDVSAAFRGTEFRAFAQTLAAGGQVKAIVVPVVPGTPGVRSMSSPRSRPGPARKDLPRSRSRPTAFARQ